MTEARTDSRASPLPKLAVWKFSSCDGCQLTLLDCEDELLGLAERVDIAYFPEATSREVEGPYDVSLVEGSVTTPHELERIVEVRQKSHLLIAIGACATAGGIQALRNFAEVEDFKRLVYARPEVIDTLDQATPFSEYVKIDMELRGCPISKAQLLQTLTDLLSGQLPALPTHSVCEECKKAGNPCVMVAHGTPCLGPVTQAGCNALCPRYNRGCYGCYGPVANANTQALSSQLTKLGMDEQALQRVYRTFNAAAPAFRDASQRHEAES